MCTYHHDIGYGSTTPIIYSLLVGIIGMSILLVLYL